MLIRAKCRAGLTFIICLLPALSRAQTIAPPRSFEAIAMSPTEIRCYWLPGSNATGYTLQRDGRELAQLPVSAREYADRDVMPGSTHRYALRAVRNGQPNQTSAVREYTERSFAEFPSASGGTGRGTAQVGAADFDVVIVQASSGGVAAAVEAGRRGLRTALIEPTTRIGGMPVNGLSATDLRRGEHASGFVTRFRDTVKTVYAAEGVQANGLQYEPRVAHQAMKSLLYSAANVTVFRRARLSGVRMDSQPNSRRVRSALVEELNAQGEPTGRKAAFRAKVFIDATDCGDLAAMARAPFRIGREPRSAEEPHNGVIYYDRKNDKLLPGSTGAGDRRLQSYAYLVTVKDYGSGADMTIPKPAGYKREDYIHTPAWKESWAVTSGKMPNGKYELNQHPQGGDLQEVNYGYPEGDYNERARVEKLYQDRGLGYLYYIQTEQGQKQIGLPDDEYRDSGGFPPLLYVREGRRIVGEQLPVEADIVKTRDRAHPESIGLGDYPMDSHAVRVKTDWTTPDMGEGEWWLYQYTPPHELPLGVIVPESLDNVFVTTAVSSTHVTFGTYRMEPVRMAFGQAAGIGAYYCIWYGLAAREVPARQIQDELLPHFANPHGDSGAILTYFSDLKADHPHYWFIQYLAARGFRTEGDTFRPEAPTTRGELAQWLTLLAARMEESQMAGSGLKGRGTAKASMTSKGTPPAGMAALARLRSSGNPTDILSRKEIAVWLTQILSPMKETGRFRFSDLGAESQEVRHAAAQLAERGSDPILWDSWSAIAPDGSLLFRPDAPLRHDAMFATLYLAQIGLGPLFYDHPMDGGKGRAVAR